MFYFEIVEFKRVFSKQGLQLSLIISNYSMPEKVHNNGLTKTNTCIDSIKDIFLKSTETQIRDFPKASKQKRLKIFGKVLNGMKKKYHFFVHIKL